MQIQISCSEQTTSSSGLKTVLAQGALIQVQQGLGKHMATKKMQELASGTEVTELLVET